MPEQIKKAIEEKIDNPAEQEEKKVDVEALQKALEEKEAELNKLRQKDYNFKRLRDMTEEEKQKLSQAEIELKKNQEELEERMQTFTESAKKEKVDIALGRFAAGDKDLGDKIMHHFNRLKDEGDSQEAITRRMEDAYMLATGLNKGAVNPIHQSSGAPSGYRMQQRSGGDSELTEGQKELARKLGIDPEKDLNLKNPLEV